MAFRLALALGWMDPGAMVAEMTPELWLEWLAFWQLEPFGPVVSWWQRARQMAQLANLFRGKNQPPFEYEDFMPNFEPRRQKSPNEIYALLRTWALLNGAKPKSEVVH